MPFHYHTFHHTFHTYITFISSIIDHPVTMTFFSSNKLRTHPSHFEAVKMYFPGVTWSTDLGAEDDLHDPDMLSRFVSI